MNISLGGSYVRKKRKGRSVYRHVCAPCECGLRRERERERGSADTSDASRTETVLLEMTCYTRLQEFIAGSKFIPRSQLLYGPCMSSLTAAVFTSRLD